MVIILICYHLVVLTDFVPPFEHVVKDTTSLGMISVVCMTTAIYVAFIVIGPAFKFAKKCYLNRKEVKVTERLRQADDFLMA